jgi:hypothetical protein
LRENNNDLNSKASGSTAYWEEKVNLWVDAKIAEGLKGYVELQSGSANACNSGATGKGWMQMGTAGTDCQVGAGTGTGRGNTDSAPNSMFNENRGLGFMEIRYAYIEFMIPKTPVGIKIGHFPVVLGHSIWVDTSYWGSDGLLISSSPIKDLTVGFGTFKFSETAANGNPSDTDLYVLMASYPFMPKNTAGFNLSYLSRPGKGTLSVGYDMALYNFMLAADGALDFGLGYKFEFDFQAGTLYDYDATYDYDAGSALTDVSASGFALLLGATYGIAEIVEAKFNLGYGSGDKISSADKNEGYFSFNNFGYTMVYEDIVGQKTGNSTLGAGDFGLNNTMYINVGAGATPMKNMSVGMDIFYLMSIEENYAGQKKNIGFEVDLNFGYQIYKNLKWTFLAGYFMPGDHYETVNSTDTVKTDAAWAFEQVLSLGF